MKASDIISEAATVLLDPDHQFWPTSELLQYINAAQVEIVNVEPGANTVTEAVTLVAGVEQLLPAGAIRLIDVITNTSDGAVTAVDRRNLDRMVPGWMAATAADTEHYMYDERAPASFAVYPPATAGSKVTAIYVATPEPAGTENDDLALPGRYRPAIVNYVLSQAHAKNTQAAVPQRAQAYYQLFLNALNMQTQSNRAQSAGHPDDTNPRELR